MAKCLKICLVSNGGLVHTMSYIESLQKMGHEVYLIALSKCDFNGVKIFNVWQGRTEYLGKLNYIFAAVKARRLVSKLSPDIVHAHYATSGGLAAFIMNQKNTMLTVHGSDINIASKSFLWRFLLRRIFKRCLFINTVSRELEKKVVALGVSPEKVFNINMGIDFDTFYINRVEAPMFGTLNIICNRAFKELYNHKTLLNAVLLLKESGYSFKLNLIGDGPLKTEFEKYVLANDLRSCVKFVGHLNYLDQLSIFKQANVYVSCSLSDGTSLSLLEGMAAGLFPIVSNIPANSDWIIDKTNGFLFDAEDSFALYKCLKQFNKLETPFIYKSILDNQNKVSLYGDRVTNMSKIDALYQKIVE